MAKQRRPTARAAASKSAAKRRASAKPAKRRTAPKAAKRRASAKPAKRRTAPKAAKRRTIAKSAKRRTAPKAAKRRASAKPAKRRTAPKAAKRRASAKPAKRRTAPKAAKRRASAKPAKRQAASKAAQRRPTTAKAAVRRRAPAAGKRRAQRAPVVKIRQAYAKAVALYEKGVKALQRKRFAGAATAFRQVLEQFPEERELHERARLYLNVCKREMKPVAKTPKSVKERILAATLALNSRDVDQALTLLRRSPSSDRKHDHIQYMLALAHALRDDVDTAVEHLVQAIALNPSNRLQAIQEPDFDSIRGTQPFLDAIKQP